MQGLLLMEYRYTTQVSTRPFCFVLVHIRIYCFQERTNEGGLPGRTGDTCFVPDILDYRCSSAQALAQRKRLILTLIIRNAGQKKGEEKAPPIDPTVQLGNQSAHWDIRQRRELRVGGGRGEAGIYSSCRHFCKLRVVAVDEECRGF